MIRQKSHVGGGTRMSLMHKTAFQIVRLANP